MFRVDDVSWRRFADSPAFVSGAVLFGAFVIMAWNRFGAQGLASPRAAVRLILIGFYGWMGLALSLWVIGRVVSEASGSVNLGRLVQLTGFAHIPLLTLAIVVQVSAVMLQLLGPGLVVAVFGLGLWMPAMLVGAVRHAFEIATLRAAAVVVAPYIVWLLSIGRHVLDLVGHLL